MIARDPEAEAGYDYLITILLIMPMLMLWSSTVMDHNLRKNNGFGSSYVWDCCFARCCRARPSMRRHLGTDAIVSMWLFAVLMVPAQLAMTVSLLDYLTDLSMWLSYLMMSSFTGGTLLMLKASYPENFGKSSFFRQVDDDPDD